jgi:hypothetical protein
MLILPYTHSIVNNNNLDVNIIRILTIGGKTLWEENNSLHIDNDILNSNDIYRKSIPIKFDNNLYLCEIDIEKTNISEFYKWEEISINDNDTFCWKTYYYFTGSNKISWLDIPDSERLSNYKVKDLIRVIVQKKIEMMF